MAAVAVVPLIGHMALIKVKAKAMAKIKATGLTTTETLDTRS